MDRDDVEDAVKEIEKLYKVAKEQDEDFDPDNYEWEFGTEIADMDCPHFWYGNRLVLKECFDTPIRINTADKYKIALWKKVIV